MESLLNNLMEFISVLRLSGIRASTSEAMDAAAALEHVPLEEREAVKAALSSCLAKSEEERDIFSKAFEAFFIAPGVRKEFIETKRNAAKAAIQEINRQAEELQFQGEPISLPEELKEVYASLPETEKQSIKEFLDKTSTGKNVGQRFKPIAEGMVQSRLNSARNRVEGKPYTYETLLTDAGIVAGEVRETLECKDRLLHKNIAGLSEEEIPAAVQMIRRLADRLKKKMQRKYGTSRRKRRLDIKNTIRGSLHTGGWMFRLKYRNRKKRKERFLVLCDVSASMQRFSGFVLQFIHSMHADSAETDAYIFSESVEHLNFSAYSDYEGFSAQVKASREWKRGTNIKTALEFILDRSRNLLNSSTLVILVSDAKTLEAAAAAARLKDLGERVRKIIWLNPISERDWPRIPSYSDFSRECTMLDCSTLEKLAAACSKLGS